MEIDGIVYLCLPTLTSDWNAVRRVFKALCLFSVLATELIERNGVCWVLWVDGNDKRSPLCSKVDIERALVKV